MAVFAYKGMDVAGKRVSGMIDAENLKSARMKLRKSQIFPTVVSEGSSRGGGATTGRFNLKKIFEKKVKPQELAAMTRQLATLVNANVPLVDALNALVDQTEHEKLKSALSQIRERVKEGARLADAMLAYPNIFEPLYINMVRSGEVSGALDTILLRLADFTESQARLRRKVKGAMIYPVIMGVVGVILMAVILGFAVPKITKVFAKSKQALPLPTEILIGVSDFVQHYFYLIFLLAFGIYWGLKKYRSTPKGRLFFDRLALRLPIFGELVRMVAISRFCRTLSTLMKSGVQLMNGLDIVKGVVHNVVLTSVIEDTQASVKEGESIAGPLKRSGQFPPLVTHMITLGEKTGELETMLERVADAYEEQIDGKVAALMSVLEPLIVLGMGGMIAGVVIAIMLPILKLNELAV